MGGHWAQSHTVAAQLECRGTCDGSEERVRAWSTGAVSDSEVCHFQHSACPGAIGPGVTGTVTVQQVQAPCHCYCHGGWRRLMIRLLTSLPLPVAGGPPVAQPVATWQLELSTLKKLPGATGSFHWQAACRRGPHPGSGTVPVRPAECDPSLPCHWQRHST